MPSIWPDRQFYSDVGGTLKRGLLDPDFYKGFAKEATVGLLGAPGDIGYLMGGVLPAAVHNWREGLPLSQDMGRPEDYAFTSESLADTFGVPFTGSGPENAGRVLGGVLDVGNMAGFLRHTARGLPDGVINTGPMGKQQGMFGGVKGAENLQKAGNDAPMSALRHAEMAEYSGKTPDVIWRETGEQFGYPVYRGADGQWRFEIDDSGAGFKSVEDWGWGASEDYKRTNSVLEPTSDVYQHPELAQAYPDQWGNTDTLIGGNYSESGSFGPTDFGRETIRIGRDPNNLPNRSVMSHELQHGLPQAAEGFARGGSPDSAIADAVVSAGRSRRAALNDEYQDLFVRNQIGDIDDVGRARLATLTDEMARIDADVAKARDMNPFDAYQRLVGEEEARAVQKRMNLTQPERIQRPAWLDFDTPMDEQIVRYGDGPAMSAGDKMPSADMYVKVNGKRVNVLQNPTDEQFASFRRTVREELEDKYGKGGDFGPLTRKTMDAEGNTWVWSADDTVHGWMEPELSKMLGREVNQNPDMLKPLIDDLPMDEQIVRYGSDGPAMSELPMDEASRMQRAREMGFDVDNPVYHGTPDARGIHEDGFSVLTGSGREPGPTFFSDDYKTAASYADDHRAWDYQNAEPETIKAFIRQENPLVVDASGETFRGIDPDKFLSGIPDGPRKENMERIVRRVSETTGGRLTTDHAVSIAKQFDYDGLVIRNVVDDYAAKGKPSNVMVTFNPNQIRSPSAKFDPAKKDSANILAGMGGLGLLGAAGLYQPDSGKPPGS